MSKGTCPVCNGTLRRPAGDFRYKTTTVGYDALTDTLPCNNCGGQAMYGRPTGQVSLREDGSPCTHEYTSEHVGRCLTRYSCIHCDYAYSIDSGD